MDREISSLQRLCIALACAASVACVSPRTVECFGNLCPQGTVCVDAIERCAAREQVQACEGLRDGAPCGHGDQAGVCGGGVCAAGCGDGIALGGEVCDGVDTGDMTCEDFDFYAGNVTCSDSCDAVGTDSCVGFCGDGVINGPEICDAASLTVECVAIAYTRGVPSCGLDCQWPSSGCALNNALPVPGLTATTSVRDTAAFSPAQGLVAGDGAIFEILGDRLRPMPTAIEADFVKLWAPTPTIGFAVTATGEIVRRNGNQWELETAPSVASLADIHGLDGDRVWAVGGTSVLQLDGDGWTELAGVPAATAYRAIQATEDAGQVRLWLGATADAPLHMFEMGGWIPIDGLAGHTVTEIHAASPTEVFVATQSSPTTGALFRVHFDTTWQVEDLTATAGLPGLPFTTVTGRGSQYVLAAVVAPGDPGFPPFVPPTPPITELWRFDGSDWSRLEASVDLAGLSVGPAVAFATPSFATSTPGIRRYDGSSWTVLAPVAIPGGGAGPILVTGAALASTGELVITASGGDDVDPYLWRFNEQDGLQLVAFPVGAAVPLRDALALDGGDRVVVVGDSGALLVRDSGVWARSDVPGAPALRSVHGRALGSLYAVGEGGVYHFDGTVWTQVYDSGAITLEHVWVAKDGFAAAVGEECTLVTNARGTWEPVTPPPPCEDDERRLLSMVWTDGVDNVHVAESGVATSVHKFDGAAWSRAWDGSSFNSPGVALVDWRGLHELADGDVVSFDGLMLLHGNGTTWSRVKSLQAFASGPSAVAGDGRSIVTVDGGFRAVFRLEQLWPWSCADAEAACGDGVDDDCDGDFDTDDSDCGGN